MTKQVRYGDQVYIELSNLQPPPTTDIRLLCSNSFLEENVFAVKSSTYNKTSFRNSVFVVLPSLVDSQADLDTLHSLGTELSFLSLGKPNTVGEKYLKKEIDQKEDQIHSSKETLKILNEKIMNEMENRTVRYGEVVLLKHLESGYYLCADSSYLPHNPTFYNLRLQKERTSNCYFKFFSYSVMTDRSPIDYENETKLVSAQLGTIVTMGPIRNSVDSLNLNKDDDEKDIVEKPIFPADWQRREEPLKTFNTDLLVVGTTLESSDNNRIKLIEYCTKEDLTAFNARKIIKNGDYIRFQIDDSYLTYSQTIYRQTFGLFNHNIEGYKYNFLNSIFQIVRMDDGDTYPKGAEVQSNPKTIEDENDVAKYYLKHFVTGHYLSVPEEKTYVHQAGDDDMLERPAEIPYFYMINNYLKNQKNPLTRNSRISLKAFKNLESVGEFYLESEVEKYEVLQLDTNSRFFVGFRNSEDKIRGKLKLVKKNITGNQAVGSFFKVTSVSEEEMTKVMTFESFTNAMKRFMRVLQCALKQNKKVSAVTFQVELLKILNHSRSLISLLTSNDTQAAIFAREFKVLDTICKFLYNFLLNPEIQNVVKNRKFDLNQLVEFLENLTTITLNATHGNELTHIYVSQFVRTFIRALFTPSPLFNACDKRQSIILKDKIILLLYRFLWDKDLDTLGQLNYFENDFFTCLDNHQDYTVHLLQLLNHYCSSKAPNLENTLRSSFITKYASDDNRIKKIFPVLQYIPNEDDFELTFERPGYDTVMRLGSAPQEVHDYLVWTFKVINAVSEIKSLKFLSTIINYYPENICESLVTCKKVAPNVKNEVLITMKNVHFGYGSLPFDAIPQKIQVVLSSDKLDKYLKSYSSMVMEAEQTIVSDLERDLVMRNRPAAKGTKGISVQSLTADILKNESEQLNKGNLQSLQFTLQVMKNILSDEHSLTYENLYRIHHSLCHIIEEASNELCDRKVGPYYEPFAHNKEKIYEVLKEVDEHIVRLAFKEAINNIKDKVLKASSNLQQISTVGAFSQPLATTYHALEEDIIKSAIDSMSEDWKSKRKLYDLAHQTARDGTVADSMQDETRLLQSLWKIIKSGETALTNATVNLVKNKTNFETKFTKELSECSLLDEEVEVSSFIELASGLLAINKVGRRIRAKIEFGFTEKETQDTIEEIIDKLEKILVTIYDYEGHLAEEGHKIHQEQAKELFLKRLHYSKIKTAQEVPFGYKPAYIKTFYQKVLRMLDTHEILIPLIGFLHYRTAFDESVDPQRAKYAYTLIMMIICLFLHKNTPNQAMISNYPEFIIIYYSELESVSVEAILMFAEMCNNNRKLLRLSEDYLFAVTSYTFVSFLNEFKVNAEQADSSNSINYIRSLPYVFSSDIPKDMFDPAEFMTSRFFEFYNFIATDKRISLTGMLASHTHETNKALSDLAFAEIIADENKIILDMPIFYSILKEFLGAEVTFALTEIKERVLALHSSLTLERVTPFLVNENIEFNFELKQLAMQILENLYFKNTYKNTNIFYNYDHFVSFASILLVDVYGYLKNLDKGQNFTGFLLNLFQSGFFTSEAAKNYIQKYDNLLHQTDLNNIVFLQYQSLMLFSKIWKDYIYYILCDFWGNLISYVKDFMLVNKEKDANRLNVFEIWFELISKLKETETDPQYRARIDNALKNSIVLADYAKYRERIYAILGQGSDLKQSKTSNGKKKQAFQLDIEKILNRYFGEKSTYKITYTELNLNYISKIMGADRAVIKKLIGVLNMPETPKKDTIFILKLFRKLIENENETESNKTQPIYLWDDVSQGELKRIVHIQETLGELKIVNAIFALLYKYEKDAVALREILLLCVSLLFGGNSKMQDAFYEEFKQDYDNEIIQNLTSILEDTLEAFSVKQQQKTTKSYFRALQFIFTNLGEYPQTSGLLKDLNFEVPADVKEKLSLKYSEELEESGEEAPSIPVESYKLLSIILKFLQNLCEGHYLNFQEFLRDQTIEKHSRSFNIPEFLRQAYHAYYKNLSADNIQIGTKILDLLIEIEQGESLLNIQLLLQKTFLNDICNTLDNFNNDLDLLARGFKMNRNQEDLMELKKKGLVLLKDLVERSEPQDLKTIVQHLNLRSLVTTFKENVVAFHEKKGGYPSSDKLEDKDIWDSNLSCAFIVYFILKHLSFEEDLEDFAPEIQEQIDSVFLNGKMISREMAYKYLKRFFKKYTGSIEIFQKKSNRLMKIYFPASVMNDYLKADAKEEFEEKVDRSNTQTKIADLLDASEELISQMEVNYKSRNRLFGFNPSFFYTLLRIATSILAFTIGLYNMFELIYVPESVADDGTPIPSDVKYKLDGDQDAQIGINVTQSVISVLLLVLWLYLKLGSYLSFKWNDYVNNNVKEYGVLPPDVLLKIDRKEALDRSVGLQILKLRGPYSEEWEAVQDFMAPTLRLYNVYFLLQSAAFLWQIIYIGICIGSIFHPLVAAFQMCDIVIKSDSVARIATAVTRNAKQFMWTLILLFVTVYIYSFIGFYFIHDRFIQDDVDNCQDAYSCFLTSLNQGLRAGGGIGDFINAVVYNGDNKEEYFWNTVYDLSFFILMITLLLNLIFGMIIDAFGELRDEKNENEDDKRNVCFICGLERGEYERLGNFDTHIYQEHHMWQYLAYLVYLRAKEKAYSSELTDVESYVMDCLERQDYGWLPVGRSLTLERQYAKNKKEDKSEVLELREDVVKILNKVVEQNSELNIEVKELKSYIYKSQPRTSSLSKKPTEKST